MSNNPISKKQLVRDFFDHISTKYDFLNHLLSLNLDVSWRKKTIKLCSELDFKPKHILDIATGTGDLALEALKLNPDQVIGLDISEGMLQIAKQKINKKNEESRIQFTHGDVEHLSFEDNTFDLVISGFGVRNFENLEQGLKEMYRVLRPGGSIAILEFSKTNSSLFKDVFNFYFYKVLPKIGKWVSNNATAYSYLPQSVNDFPYGNHFLDIISNIGFKNTKCFRLTLGVCSVYLGQKLT